MSCKKFRQRKGNIDNSVINEYVAAIQAEGLCLQVEIAHELAVRDQLIDQQTRIIKELTIFINGGRL